MKSQMGNIKVRAGRQGLGLGEVDGVTWVLIKIKVPVWTFIISSKSVEIACADSIRERTGRRHCRRRQPCVSQSRSAITSPTSAGLLVTTASRSNKQTQRRVAQLARAGASPLCFANKSGAAAQRHSASVAWAHHRCLVLFVCPASRAVWLRDANGQEVLVD